MYEISFLKKNKKKQKKQPVTILQQFTPLPVSQYLFKENKKGEKNKKFADFVGIFGYQGKHFIKAFKIHETMQRRCLNFSQNKFIAM